MPNAYVVNRRPFHNGTTLSTYGETLSLLVEMLVSAGWTYKASGDGLAAFNATGKVFTTTGTGATGWNNVRAWARVQDPAGNREFCFQLGSSVTTNGSCRVKYSANAKFTGGSPSATVVPSAADERVLWSAGNDATPTFNLWMNNVSATSYGGAQVGATVTTGNVVYQGAAMSAPPYGFWFASINQDGSKTKGAGILYDPVISAPEDTDPYVIAIGGLGASTPSFLQATTNFLCRDGNTAGTWTTAPGGVIEGAWAHMDTGRTLFSYVQPGGYAANVGPNLLTGGQSITMAGAGGLTINPFNGKHEALPVAWMRASIASVPGLKGWSTMTRWATISQINTSTPGGATVKNTFQETLDNKNWICVGAFWLPWDGTSIAIS